MPLGWHTPDQPRSERVRAAAPRLHGIHTVRGLISVYGILGAVASNAGRENLLGAPPILLFRYKCSFKVRQAKIEVDIP